MDVTDEALDPRLLRRLLKQIEKKNLVHDVVTLGRPLIKDLKLIFKEINFEKMAEGGALEGVAPTVDAAPTVQAPIVEAAPTVEAIAPIVEVAPTPTIIPPQL